MYDRDKYLEKIIKNTIGLDEKFRFNCKGCGNCCRNRDDIMLSPYDLFRACKCLNLSHSEFIEKYCEVYQGKSSKVPVVRLKPKPVYEMLFLKTPISNKTECPLLKDNHCIVHKSKPIVCALYPLGRFWNAETNEINYIMNENVKCNDKSENFTVREWLEKFGVPESDKSLMLWGNIVAEYSKLIENLSHETQDKIYNAFYNLFYENYKMNKEFVPQFENKIKKFKEIIN
jgi:Fe-S-cluster containining protein